VLMLRLVGLPDLGCRVASWRLLSSRCWRRSA